MVDYLHIFWEKIRYNDLSEVKDTYFYAFTRGKTVVYIGMSYYQHIRNEVRSTIYALDLDNIGLVIWLGYIIKSSYRRITERIIRDVECLLIYTHRPSYNTQCVANYSGRDSLKIVNKGCKYLRPCVMIKNNKVYMRCI